MLRGLDIDARTWETLSELLDAALDLPPPERQAWLDALDVRHSPLKPRLRALLARAANVETDFLTALPPLQIEDEVADRRMGPYRLLRELGSGGMGVVWLAERADALINRPVALKFPRGAWIREGLRERMAREREILAALEHPGIARLYDAGVTDQGDPYLALEFVDGVPLDAYVAERRPALEDCLRLFLQVADAVAYAHSKLIVHRDLKPANILVTPDGHARLLDFGIGKLQGEQQAHGAAITDVAGRALTPDYASPEQIAGRMLTVATDVYSLGVILYELLTGQRPYRVKRDSRGALEDAILDAEPQRPSDRVDDPARRRAVGGDLDAITLKALKKDPTDRYGSVTELAADLRRYLDDQPVTVRADALTYRARKFIRRHRSAVTAASAMTVLLLTATFVTALQSVEARRQRDAALYQQQRAQAANEFMDLMLTEIGPGGEPLTPLDLLDRAAAMLDRQYGTEQRFLGPMFYELATSYFSLGRVDRLIELLGRAERLAREGEDADLLAAVLCTMGRVQLRNQPDTARRQIEEARVVLARAPVPSVDSTVSCARADAALLQLQGDRNEAIETLRATLASLDGNPAASVQSRLYVMNELAALHYNQRQLHETLKINDEILRLMEASGRGATVGYVVMASNGAAILHLLGEITSAFEIRRALLQRMGELELEKRPLGLASHYAGSLIRLARYEEALAILREEARIARAAGNEFLVAENELQIARVLMLMERFTEASALLDSAEPVLRKAEGTNERTIEMLVLTRAQARLGLGDPAGARAEVAAELERMGYPARKDHPGLYAALRVASTVTLEAGEPAAAQRYADDFLALARGRARVAAQSADVGEALLLRAKARVRLQDRAGASTDLQAARVSLRNGLGDDHPKTREALAMQADF